MATASGKLVNTQQNCGGCNKPSFDDGSKIVCQQCRRWYHDACGAGVGQTGDGSWSCVACVLSTDGPAKSIISTSSTRSARMRLELMRLDEMQQAKEKHMIERQEQERLREERIQREKESLTQKYIDEKYALLMSETLEDGASSVRSRGSRQKSLDRVKEWMEISATGTALGDSIISLPHPPATGNQNNMLHGTPRTSVGAKAIDSSEAGQNIAEIRQNRNLNLLHPPQETLSKRDGVFFGQMYRNGGTNLLQKIEENGSALIPASAATQTLPPTSGPTHTVSFVQNTTDTGLQSSSSLGKIPLALPITSVGSQFPTPRSTVHHVPASDTHIPLPSAPDVFSIIPPEPTQLPVPESSSVRAPVSLSGNPVHAPNALHQQPFRPLHGGQALHMPAWQPHHSPAGHSRPQQPCSAYYGVPETFIGQYQQQMAARQVVPRELPVFTGHPEDWPIFISSYRNSTTMCGYTDAENLMRLQKCLRGTALDVVRSNLLLPSSVPQVLTTLETLFGNPERIIQSLLTRVRNTPAPRADKLETLINFGVVVQNLVGHLKAANQQVHLTNPSLLRDLVDKLPANIRLDWALYKKRVVAADLETFSTYMSAIISAASDVTNFSEIEATRPIRSELKPKEKAFMNVHNSEDNYKQVKGPKGDDSRNKNVVAVKPCFVCEKLGHRVKECFMFKSFSLIDRWNAVKTHQLCHKCLVPHGRWPCRTLKSCDISGCVVDHHSLLHPGDPESSEVAVVAVHRQPKSHAIFRIIPVILYGKATRFETFAFLDEGSDLTLMDEEIADLLGVDGEKKGLCIKWTSNVTRDEANSRQINLEITGADGGKRLPLVNVRTVGRLDLPLQTLNYNKLATRFTHLKRLPIRSYENAAPRLLIGLSNLQLAVPLKCREGRVNEPVATKTRLGWTVFGNMTESNMHHSFHICECTTDEKLHDLVKEFFAAENLGITSGPLPEGIEDARAKAILRDTTRKDSDGHFETGLLWRYDQFEFPPSYMMAARRFRCLERRLRTQTELRNNLDKQIAEYLVKGYAHKASQQEIECADPKRAWYLPLGVVISPKKPGKIRIIWDAAAKVDGVSFNSMLLKGPDMLTSLPSVLFRFRERKFCVTADIKEMYHQVKIRPVDRSSQRFLYRSDPSEELETYIMDVATFGSTCSPCSAQHVKNLNAAEWKDVYPEAASAIVENHYVDDYLDSRDTEDELASIAGDVRTVHSKAGFDLRNWRSNSNTVLQKLGEEPASTGKIIGEDKSSRTERVLGMTWLPDEDAFTFALILPADLQRMTIGNGAVTKRGILRMLMSLFDPHGLISNFLVHGKILIQDLWRSGVTWDEAIPQDILARWNQWVNQLPLLENIRVPRCYFPNYSVKDLQTIELHVFVDASESAYACVAYFRIIEQGKPRCAFVCSKAKVAPLKPLSIPRLELQAGVIGSRLAKTIKNNHTLPIQRTVYHSDASTLLSWIRSDTRKYRQYVAVRIGEILETTDVSEWRWVPTKLNVADEATKWGNGPALEPDSRWFKGPAFLYLPEECWPQQKELLTDTAEELRSVYVHQDIVRSTVIEVSRFSKWERLLRSMAYVYHFICCCRSRREERSMLLEPTDFERGEQALWRLAQADAYADELVELTKYSKKTARRQLRLEKSSSIRKLSPFLDEFGVIRMEGRIEASPLATFDAKYPIILPKKHYVTELLIDWYHRRFGHGFGETVVNEIRQKFHVSNLRVLVRGAGKRCMSCLVRKAVPENPRMAPLPAARLAAFERPFSRVGIDYCGPFLIKVHRSTVKRWVALFTCLVTRAVHLEVVASLSTESCKLALRRFIDRRGAPAEIYTDNGTNFHGTYRELNMQVLGVNKGLAETFTDANTRWFFIPPASPHMGGVWERMIRSIKTAMEGLRRLREPTEEVFQTVCTEAESMINCRPLTYIPLETPEQEALTPNHFLLLSSSGIKQTLKHPTTEGTALRSNWDQCQLMLDRFWTRWIREYLPTITRRTKWFEDVQPLVEGSLVFIVNDKERNSWARGKVVKLIPGADGRIRQADVQVAGGGILRRAVAKLAVLDVLESGKAGGTGQLYGLGDVGTGNTDDRMAVGATDSGDLDHPSI
ncbi:uncharacterized protein LOC134284186 [Aedes albopictus]|uniref:Endonuclease n=1 Tax=Aedes albopictus TaxID=7160 RepID=A0ABM1ZY77_AEDAL